MYNYSWNITVHQIQIIIIIHNFQTTFSFQVLLFLWKQPGRKKGEISCLIATMIERVFTWFLFGCYFLQAEDLETKILLCTFTFF